MHLIVLWSMNILYIFVVIWFSVFITTFWLQPDHIHVLWSVHIGLFTIGQWPIFLWNCCSRSSVMFQYPSFKWPFVIKEMSEPSVSVLENGMIFSHMAHIDTSATFCGLCWPTYKNRNKTEIRTLLMNLCILCIKLSHWKRKLTKKLYIHYPHRYSALDDVPSLSHFTLGFGFIVLFSVVSLFF